MTRTHAGTRAGAKYDELAKGWRKRNRPVFIGVGAFCFTILAISFISWVQWPGGGYFFGIVGGAVMGLWVAFRETPPAWIEQWQIGAWAEQKTAKRLEPLEADGWVVIHDLSRGRGNVDHVVIGPGGVFVLDTKRTDGRVEVVGDEVTVTRHDDPDLRYTHTGARHVVRLAMETHAQLLAARRIRQWVTPVVVWWADFPQGVDGSRCAHVHGDELADWLRNQPQRIAPTRVPQMAEAVRAAWATTTSDATQTDARPRTA